MIRKAGLLIPLVAVLVLAGSALIYAQRFRGGFGGYFEQNNPPETELIMARWQFRARGKFGGTGWSHNYPTSELHLNQLISEATIINIQPASYRIVQLESPEIFKYPFAYVSEPGEMWLTDQEVMNLREYVDRGGFVLIDDFDGAYDLGVLKRELKRAFPERDLVRMTIEHPIFHVFYDIDALEVMSPYQVGEPAIFYGLDNGHGDLAVIACHNNDLANYWDWIDQRIYPLKPSIEAFRLGINFVLYAMTR